MERGRWYAGCLLLLTVLWGCAPTMMHQPASRAYRQAARTLGQELAQALRSNPFLQHNDFIIVPAKRNRVVHDIDDLTEAFRQELYDTLLEHRVQPQTRYPLHGPFQPQRLERVYCGRDSTRITMYLLLDILPVDAGQVRAVLKAYDLEASRLLPFKLAKAFAVTAAERQMLAQKHPDTDLEGTDMLPFQDSVKDRVAKYIGYNFACLARTIDTGQEVCVSVQESLTPFERGVWEIAENYIGMYKSVRFVPAASSEAAAGCFPLEVKGYQDKEFRVIWITGPERFSLRVYHRGSRNDLAHQSQPAAAAPPVRGPEPVEKPLAHEPQRTRSGLRLVVNRDVYRPGDLLTLRVHTAVDGYVSLIAFGTSGRTTLLYPNTFSAVRRLRAGQQYTIPSLDDPFTFEVSGPPGIERIKGVMTAEPLALHRLPVQQGFYRLDGAPAAAGRDTAGLWQALRTRVLAQDTVQFRVRE